MKIGVWAAVGGVALIAAVAGIATYRSLQAPKQASEVVNAMPVYPEEAAGLPPVDLADLVALLAPARGFSTMGWDYLADDPHIHWITDGIDRNNAGATRDGLVRVRAAGKLSTVIKQKLSELAWTITLATDGPEKFGPKSISITPGGRDGPEQCFGAEYTNCTFPVEAAILASANAHKICAKNKLGGATDGYLVELPTHISVALLYSIGGGSGGSNSELSILSPVGINPETLCD